MKGNEDSRTLRMLDLRRYRALRAVGATPTGRDHAWGRGFERSYPLQCPSCQCFTRSPFDRFDIIHDVDACAGGKL